MDETSSSSSPILCSVVSNVSSKNASLVAGKPVVAEILVEGELSPFEHEALFQLIKKYFLVKQPTYTELDDETVGTRISIIFRHSYDRDFFTHVFQKGWRDLKDLFKQINYRRGRLGAAFSLCFADSRYQLIFSTGLLDDQALGSAMDQLAHLTGIVGQMLRPETMNAILERIEAFFDGKIDRWSDFRAFDPAGKKEYMFDEKVFRWTTLL